VAQRWPLLERSATRRGHRVPSLIVIGWPPRFSAALTERAGYDRLSAVSYIDMLKPSGSADRRCVSGPTSTFRVFPREVHALLGDNGAGKSTLMKLLSGFHTPTSGEIIVEGVPVHFKSPRDASAAGIGTVYQDLALNHLMSVSRNFFMGCELTIGPRALGILDLKKIDAIAKEEMHKIGIKVTDPNQPVGTMSGGQRQTLAIARAIYFGAKVLILDEPTSALGQKQQMEVLKTIMRGGHAVTSPSSLLPTTKFTQSWFLTGSPSLRLAKSSAAGRGRTWRARKFAILWPAGPRWPISSKNFRQSPHEQVGVQTNSPTAAAGMRGMSWMI
jgi:ABC-type cobalamin/Fe3+-siderophores transport system ATPase subunit